MTLTTEKSAATPMTFDQAEAMADQAHITSSLTGVRDVAYWLDSPDRPEPEDALAGPIRTDLAVVGGGYTGLWTALMAKERDPDRRVTLLEARSLGWAASGRNGGFCSASLTHGAANGRKHLPHETDLLKDLGAKNLNDMAEALRKYGIDCDWQPTGTLNIATEPHQVHWLRDEARLDPHAVFFTKEQLQAEINSPTYQAGLWHKTGSVLLDPAKLAWGLARACKQLGVEIYENTPVEKLKSSPAGVLLSTPSGTVHAKHVALGTNAFPSLLKRTQLFTVPVYDFALITEPLSAAQLDAIGWKHRQGLSDLNNRFHYYRLTADNRILFGGYDALYHFGRRMRPEYERSTGSTRRLAAHFFATFPQLADVRFTHAWGGAIDTCSRFFSFFTLAHGGRVAYTAGYTGLGVGATRFGANVMLDLLSGADTELTRLAMVRKLPLPFPPEPIAWLGVKMTTAAMIRQDRRQGKRGLWLKFTDAVGMGFDS